MVFGPAFCSKLRSDLLKTELWEVELVRPVGGSLSISSRISVHILRRTDLHAEPISQFFALSVGKDCFPGFFLVDIDAVF